MLAWVHQSIATEKEVVLGLFGPESGVAAAAAAAVAATATSASSDDSSNPTEILDRVFEGVVRPLKV
jgi:hypothetical protein